MGVFKRGNKLWITFKGVDGKWTNKPTPFRVGQETLAQETFDAVVAGVKEARLVAPIIPARERIRRSTSRPQKIKNSDGTISWRIRFFDVDGKRASETFKSEDEALAVLGLIKHRDRSTDAPVVALKLYAVHADKAESLLTHDTLPAASADQHRTYEVTINGETWGVWLQRLDAQPADDDPLDVWQFNPETDIEPDAGGAPF